MLPNETAEAAFVVEIDRDAVARERDRVRRIMMGQVRFAFGATILILIILSGGYIWGRSLNDPPSMWLWLWVMLPTMIATLVYALHTLGQVRKQLAAWDGAPAVSVGLRLTPTGLEYRTDEVLDPVFLPWATVAGLRVVRRVGHDYLLVDPAPGVHAGTAGVRGLNQPHVQWQLRDPRTFGEKGLRHPVSTLRQPLDAIADAVAYFSQGRVRLLPFDAVRPGAL
jgi:hypothetical protein